MTYRKRRRDKRDETADFHKGLRRGGPEGRGHGGGRGGRHGGKGRGPHSRRPLGRGDLKWLLLSLIAETPRHGYELMREIESRTEGLYKPSPGVMYPAIEMLQDMGLASLSNEGERRSLTITADGKTALEAEAERIAAIHERLNALKERASEKPENIRAAMHQLKSTVKRKMRDGERNSEGKAEQEAAIMAILAKAKAEIEAL